jgi:hypothetical protein
MIIKSAPLGMILIGIDAAYLAGLDDETGEVVSMISQHSSTSATKNKAMFPTL